MKRNKYRCKTINSPDQLTLEDIEEMPEKDIFNLLRHVGRFPDSDAKAQAMSLLRDELHRARVHSAASSL